jgi:uncharacterized membrane protein YtjA (UPF0391 family)
VRLVRLTDSACLFSLEDRTMLRLAILFLVIALIAAFFGWGGIASAFMGVAQIFFVIFIILAVLFFLGYGFNRRGSLWG